MNKQIPSNKWTIYLWTKADFESNNTLISDFTVSFIENTANIPIMGLI